VPEDLSVIGMDDIPFAALHPGLTSIAAPVARAGEVSLELLGHTGTPRTVRLPTHLVVRASTGPIRSG
jgi:LacI family transcriptional regulator